MCLAKNVLYSFERRKKLFVVDAVLRQRFRYETLLDSALGTLLISWQVLPGASGNVHWRLETKQIYILSLSLYIYIFFENS